MTTVAALLRLSALLACTTLIGHAAVRRFTAELWLAERLAWKFAAGLLLHTAVYGLMLLFGAASRSTLLLGTDTLLAAGLFVAIRPRVRVRDKSPAQRSLLGSAVVLLAAAGVLLFALRALAEPMWTTDYLAIWGLKGKTIFLSADIPHRLFRDPFLFWSHPEYPLLLPMLLAALSAGIGGWQDQALALLYPALQAATVFSAWGFLSRRAVPMAPEIAALLIVGFFPLYAPANVGAAEVPLAFGLLLAATAWLDALERDSSQVRVRLALAATFCAALKQEGALFVLLLAVSLATRAALRRRPFPLAATLALLLPVAANVLVLRLGRGTVSNRDFDWTLLEPWRWGEWLERAGTTAARLAMSEVPRLALPAAAVLVLLVATRPSVADPLLAPLSAQWIAYALAPTLSAFGPEWLLKTSFWRISSALFPTFALILAARGCQELGRSPATGHGEALPQP